MRGFEVSEIESPPPGVVSKGDDAILDLEITPNRPDCLSVIGIAREVSAIYGTPLHLPNTDFPSDTTGSATLEVTVDDPQLCSRYAAAVANITVGPSPAGLAARLYASGIRPINNIVDTTNYVMLEFGHPMHAFDLNRLDGHRLRVRRAQSREPIRTIDGQQRLLDTDMLIIADENQPQAVAGVMGGADSEVNGSTRTVVLESAYFDPKSVRRTSKRLALSTEASYRFERGTDISAPVIVMQRALSLLANIGMAKPQGPIIDQFPCPPTTEAVKLRHQRITRVLGVDIDEAFVVRILERLGFTIQPIGAPQQSDEQWKVNVPSHRVDVTREIDLIEEIARHYGYDRLPASFPALTRAPTPPGRWLKRQRVVRYALTASGCSEAITYSFIDQEAAELFAENGGEAKSTRSTIAIANPLSEKFTVLRPSLLPGLIDSLIRNRRRENRDVRLFEIGKRFSHTKGETTAIAMVLTGSGDPKHWSADDRDVDLFDIKGIIERLCSIFGVIPFFEPTAHNALVPGFAASVRTVIENRRTELGYLGLLSSELAEARGLPVAGGMIYVAELSMDALEEVTVNWDDMHATPVPRYPSIVRDIAITIDASLPAGTVRDTIRATAPDTLVRVTEFDRYQGKGIPDGHVSLALHLTFRALGRTLTDEEIQRTMNEVVVKLKKEHNARLR